MNTRKWNMGGMAIAGMIVAAGCVRGPAGPAGPMGPSGGAGQPTYLFSQDFDSSLTQNQFIFVDPNTAGTAFNVVNTLFVSAPNSLELYWGSNPGNDAGLYTAAGAVPYLGGTDYTFDTYLELNLTVAGEKEELVLNVNGSTVADLGFDSTSAAAADVYTYNNGLSVPLESGLNTGMFHHAVLAWKRATGQSSVTLDGMLLAQNLADTRTPQPAGAPSTSVGVLFPQGLSAANNGVYVDNVTVYHY